MTPNDPKDSKKPIADEELESDAFREGELLPLNMIEEEVEDEGTGSDDDSGSGSQTGAIEFRDFLSTGEFKRDDALTPEERKRLLLAHADLSATNIAKQKEKRDQSKALKEGKVSRENYRAGLGNAAKSNYLPHPALKNEAQFSGIDMQVNMLATDFNTQTNEADAARLDNEYQLRYSLQNAPKFNPKPQYR